MQTIEPNVNSALDGDANLLERAFSEASDGRESRGDRGSTVCALRRCVVPDRVSAANLSTNGRLNGRTTLRNRPLPSLAAENQ